MALWAILWAGLAAFNKFKTPRELTFILFKVALRLPPLAPLTMDSFFVDLQGTGNKSILFTRLDLDDPKRATRAPLRLVTKKEGRWSQQNATAQTIHARHLSAADLNGDGVQDLIVSDHGPDIFPFPGAPTLLLLSRVGGWRATHLPFPPAFTFHTCPIDANRDGKVDLLQMNFSQKGEKIKVAAGDGHGNFRELSPWLDSPLPPRCFMSCLTTDLDGDQDPEIILGGCDGPGESPPDLVLKRGKYGLYLPLQDLAPRKHAGWGTSHLVSGKFFRSGNGVAIATHNFGFTQGEVQVFARRDEGWREADFPLSTLPDRFVLWLRAGDVNGDGLDDLLLILSGGQKPKARLFLATGDGFRASALPDISDTIIGGDIYDYDGDGKNEIVFATQVEDLLVLKVLR